MLARFKPLSQTLEEKLDDREALCRKIVFVDDSRLTADTADSAEHVHGRIVK